MKNNTHINTFVYKWKGLENEDKFLDDILNGLKSRRDARFHFYHLPTKAKITEVYNKLKKMEIGKYVQFDQMRPMII